MRKILFACLLLIALPLAAQTYPPELAGEPVVVDTDTFSAVMVEIFYNPYSVPIDETVGFLGYYRADHSRLEMFQICLNEYPVAGDVVNCLAPAPAEFRYGMTLDWNDQAGCYLETELRPDGLVAFTAVITGPVTPTLVQGCFDVGPGHPLPEFIFSDRCVMTVSELRFVPPGHKMQSDSPDAGLSHD